MGRCAKDRYQNIRSITDLHVIPDFTLRSVKIMGYPYSIILLALYNILSSSLDDILFVLLKGFTV
jgi:hypothetical protein